MVQAAHVAQPGWLRQHHRRGGGGGGLGVCKQLTALNLTLCGNITDAAVVAVALECKLLKSLSLYGCRNITDAAKANIAKTIRPCSLLIGKRYNGNPLFALYRGPDRVVRSPPPSPTVHSPGRCVCLYPCRPCPIVITFCP